MHRHGFLKLAERRPLISKSVLSEARELVGHTPDLFPAEAIARVIAGHWHGGGSGYMYSFASMGRDCPYSADQIWDEVKEEMNRTDFEESTDRAELQFLHDYLFTYHR